MAAGTYNFTIEQGATFSRTLTWKDGSGNPIDLTGYTAKLELKDVKGNVIITLTTNTGGGITLGGSAGTIAVTMTATQTAAFNFSAAHYDLKLTASDGVTVTRLLEGVVNLDDEVTS